MFQQNQAYDLALADFGGGGHRVLLPFPVLISFISMHYSGKIGQTMYMLVVPFEVGVPNLGNPGSANAKVWMFNSYFYENWKSEKSYISFQGNIFKCKNKIAVRSDTS